MDVFGRNPTSETGEYFRRNVWSWRPLADFILDTVSAEITSRCECWHDNSGNGLNAELALRLAQELRALIADGIASAYVKGRDEWLASLRDETCDICVGTGVRCDELGREAGHPGILISEPGHPRCGQKGWCNGCDGVGTVRAWATHYGLEVTDIEEFAAFVADSGGFSIC